MKTFPVSNQIFDEIISTFQVEQWVYRLNVTSLVSLKLEECSILAPTRRGREVVWVAKPLTIHHVQISRKVLWPAWCQTRRWIAHLLKTSNPRRAHHKWLGQIWPFYRWFSHILEMRNPVKQINGIKWWVREKFYHPFSLSLQFLFYQIFFYPLSSIFPTTINYSSQHQLIRNSTSPYVEFYISWFEYFTYISWSDCSIYSRLCKI